MTQWLWFILGQVINVLRQAKLVAGSTKNPIDSPWRWMHRNAIGLLVREVFAIGGWLLLTHPQGGELLIAHWWPAYAKFVFLLAEIPFLAAPFGIVFSIAADYGMEKLPWLKRHIPPLGE